MRLVACLIAALVACSSSAKPPEPSAPTPPKTPSPLTGAVSEEQFKAMHALPTAGPPARNGESIEIGGTRGYLSLPQGQGPFPAIVVIHEWWGLNANIEHWADRLASAGWAAIAVDLYGGVVATDRDAAMNAMKAVDPAKASAVIRSAFELATSDPRIKATRRAVIGWCFGGGWSLKTAMAMPELDGAIIYYGMLETDPAKLATIKARVLGVFGNRDQGIPPAQVNAFEAALEQAGVATEIYRYDADHAFANPSNPHYDETHAADAWSHVLRFLAALTS
ncbi:MAG: dienelactone hydrolase family protein [Kofleriaceae bacterium]